MCLRRKAYINADVDGDVAEEPASTRWLQKTLAGVEGEVGQ
ncbi:hypothetical protein [Subtercola boreus]|nr:hypothetical protein [Subtercola boreus]